jgi:hypothetical protein
MTWAITTSDPDAQRYFDQGLVIDFAFNHAESARSFRAAQALDPECAMCFWGEALALGPNINVTSNGKAVMADGDRTEAFTAIEKAVALKANASQQEQDYIEALAPGTTVIPRARGIYWTSPTWTQCAIFTRNTPRTTMRRRCSQNRS